MIVWRYGWTIAPLLTIVAIGIQAAGVLGAVLIVIGLFGLLLVFLKEKLERPERAKALYRVEGKEATYLYSYTEFRRYPKHVRTALLRDEDVKRWFREETLRHGGEILEAFETRFKKLRYRTLGWLLNFLM